MVQTRRAGPVLLSYTIAYVLCTLVLNYVLNVPGWVTESYDLVKEFYIKQGVQTFLVEWFVIAAYLYVGHVVAGYLGAQSNCHRFVVVLVVIAALSAAFSLLFTRLPALRGTFYQRWFDKTGWKALVCDVIYLGAVYLVFQKLLCKFKYHNLL